MYNGGWTYAQLARLHQVLIEPHRVDISVKLLTLDHSPVRDLSDVFMDGTVTLDTTGDTSRSAEVNLVDPYHQLGLDPGDPGSAIFPTRMIKIVYQVGELNGSYWWNIPIFTGPITKVDRDGVFLDVECEGKEILASGSIWQGATYAKGTNRRNVMISIMRDIGGESTSHMRIANASAIIRDDLSIKRGKDRTPFKQFKKLGASMGFQSFYDGEGTLVSQPWPTNVCFQFDEKYLTTPLQVSYNLDDLVNAVQITGGKPKNAKDPVVGKAVAPANHPLSPQALGRNGVPRYLPEFDDDDDLTTQEDVDDRANLVLANHLMGAVTLATDSIVVPHLEEGDLVIYSTPNFYGVNRLNKMTIPLTGAPTMSLGYDDKFKRGKLKRRRHKKPRHHGDGKGNRGKLVP